MDSMVKVGAIIQVRLGSERLPNKAFLPLPFGGGPTLLEHVISRAKAAGKLSEIIVATTTSTVDNAIFEFCTSNNIACFRGSENDVLERFSAAAATYNLDVVVRLTGDNPFIMPAVINETIEKHITAEVDYTLTEGLPLGTNIEVIAYSALAKATKEATEPADREHVTPFIRRESDFRTQHIHHSTALGNLRLTVDYPSDYALASMLYDKLYTGQTIFDNEKLDLIMQKHPWLANINTQNQQRQAFKNEADELKGALKVLQEGGFTRVVQKLNEELK